MTATAGRFASLASGKTLLYVLLLLGTATTIGLLSAGADSRWVIGPAVLTGLYALWMVGYLYLTDTPSDTGNDTVPPLFDPGAHPRHGVLNSIPATWLQAAKYTACCGGLIVASILLLQIHPGAASWPYQEDVDSVVLMALALLVTAASSIPIDMLGILVVRRWGRSPPPRPLAAWLLGGGIIGWLCGSLGLDAVSGRLESIANAPWPVAALEWLPLMVAAAYAVNIWIRHGSVGVWQAQLDAQMQRARAAEQGQRLAEAQLAKLQAQIEPHFLYNTLASVQYLLRKDGAAADFLLTQLIRYLRSAMPKLRAPVSTLAQEFELSDAYLQIARMRMGGRLIVSVELAESLHELSFPPLVLQTLVENALKHGVEPKVGRVSIAVRAVLRDRQLEVTVEDDGVGLGRAPGPSATAGSGTGLANIRERLACIYGHAARLIVTDRPAGGAMSTVSLTLPDIDTLASVASDSAITTTEEA